MSKLYRIRPSEIVGIVDVYTAFCFDEACAYITSRIKDGEEPNFTVKENKSLEKPHYNSLKEMYSAMGYKNGGYKKFIDSQERR